VIFFILAGLICQLILTSVSFEDMVIPEVVISDGSSTTLAMNPTYGYPLKLDGSLCFPEELSKCIDDPTLDKKCCEQLYDENSWPEETVTVLEEFLIIFFCVLTVAIIRLQLWKVTTQRSGFEYCQKYWALILWDTLFGAFLAFEYSFFLTNFLKVSVSAPRPLYYAAKIYGSVHSDHRKPFRGDVYSHSLPSFPSPAPQEMRPNPSPLDTQQPPCRPLDTLRSSLWRMLITSPRPSPGAPTPPF
jgi:hypothetical protein